MDIPLSSMAKEAGGKIYSNSIAAGVLLGVLGLGTEGAGFIQEAFAGKDDVVARNIGAVRKGYELGLPLAVKEAYCRAVQEPGRAEGHPQRERCRFPGSHGGRLQFRHRLSHVPGDGGALLLREARRKSGSGGGAGGGRARRHKQGGGGFLCGARPGDYSGGGFALMAEGLSLAGVMEAPVVVHLSQRPGPARAWPPDGAGGPELALYSGHGEFPRALFAPEPWRVPSG